MLLETGWRLSTPAIRSVQLSPGLRGCHNMHSNDNMGLLFNSFPDSDKKHDRKERNHAKDVTSSVVDRNFVCHRGRILIGVRIANLAAAQHSMM